MLSDFIISIYLANNVSSYTSHEYFIYPHFILHFLYFVPIIYYLTRPLSPFVENQKSKINTIKKETKMNKIIFVDDDPNKFNRYLEGVKIFKFFLSHVDC